MEGWEKQESNNKQLSVNSKEIAQVMIFGKQL